MSVQERMKSKLEGLGIPYHHIDVYGSQIVVAAKGKATRDKWVNLLSQFACIRGVTESYEYNKDNQNTVMNPTSYKVWRVFAKV